MARKLADTIHLRLRFDERLRRRIEKAAEQNNQSMNAEIIARLEQSFSKEDIETVIAKTAEATGRRGEQTLRELQQATVDAIRALREGLKDARLGKPTDGTDIKPKGRKEG